MLSLAMCIDEHALPGAHVTLWTALQASDASDIEVYLVHDDLSQTHLESLERTIALGSPSAKFHPISIDVSRFRGWKWISGLMTYARLTLAETISSTRVVYLDADLLVFTELQALYDADLRGRALAAVPVSSHARSNDKDFIAALSIDGSAQHFNAGVLVLDLDHWRAHDLGDRCLQFAKRHARALPSGDETVLNCLFSDAFVALEQRFNVPVYAAAPMVPREQKAGKVLHLVGRPKPWDLFGRHFNRQATMFFEEWQSLMQRNEPLRDIRPSIRQIIRTPRMVRSYWKCARNRWRH